MASQFIKNRAFIQKLKEPEVMDVDFNLEDSALDYSIESLEEDILPEAAPLPTTTSAVPLGVSSIFPFAASTILITPEYVPPFVFNYKS